MKKKKTVPVHVLLEIEKQVEKKNETGVFIYTSLSKLMHDNAISCDVLARAIDLAIMMPKKEIEIALEEYDNARPRLDAVKFVSDLYKKYDVEREDVILRIQYVRKIKMAESDKAGHRRRESASKLRGEEE